MALFTAGPHAPFSPHERGASDEVLIACGHKWFLQTLQEWPILWLDSSVITTNRLRHSTVHYGIEKDLKASAFIKMVSYKHPGGPKGRFAEGVMHGFISEDRIY